MKAILEFTAPNSCLSCKLANRSTSIVGHEYRCGALRLKPVQNPSERAPWCPLRIVEDDKSRTEFQDYNT